MALPRKPDPNRLYCDVSICIDGDDYIRLIDAVNEFETRFHARLSASQFVRAAITKLTTELLGEQHAAQ